MIIRKESALKRKQRDRKESGWEYLWLALYAFLGLGCEVILAFYLEPMIYGHGMEGFSVAESIIHWSITCIMWLGFVCYILHYAKNKLGFQMSEENEKVKPLAWGICLLLVAFVTYMNYQDAGAIKPYHEFMKLGLVKFIFQHIYYFVETMLFTLIIVFGQIAMEKWTKRVNIPFGGILVGCTWGLAHMFTKNSVLYGIEGLILGFLFGVIYLLLKRDIRKTYLVLALAFIL